MFNKKRKQMADVLDGLNSELAERRQALELLKQQCVEALGPNAIPASEQKNETKTEPKTEPKTKAPDTEQETVAEEKFVPGDNPASETPPTRDTTLTINQDDLSMTIMQREAEFLGVIKSLSSLFETTTADNRVVMENVRQLSEAFFNMENLMEQMSEKLEYLSDRIEGQTGKLTSSVEDTNFVAPPKNETPAPRSDGDDIDSDLIDLLVGDNEKQPPKSKPAPAEPAEPAQGKTTLTPEERKELIRRVLEKRT